MYGEKKNKAKYLVFKRQQKGDYMKKEVSQNISQRK